MDNYTFGMPEDILQIVEAMRRAGTQGNQPQQEPPTPAQIVTDATMQGNEANNAQFAQQQQAAAQAQAQAQAQQQQLQPLSPAQYSLGNQMLTHKQLYEQAADIARQLYPKETDEEKLGTIAQGLRDDAHQKADDVRRMAKALNVDLSGIEDVGYSDAALNLQSRQAQELVDIMSGQGKYGRSADQYFDQAYMRMISEGASPSQAKKRAGREAQQYQAERVGYLRNAFNMYGRDGAYINDNGVMMLQEIARDMPQVAQVYATAYKMPTAAQDRREKVYDTERGYQHADDVSAKDFLRDVYLSDKTLQDNITLTHVQSKVHREEAQWKSDLEFKNFVRKAGYTEAQAQRLYQLKLANAQDFATRILGLKGAQAKTAISTIMGINLQFEEDGISLKSKPSESTVKNARAFYAELVKAKDVLLKQQKQATELGDNNGLSRVNERLQAIEAQMESLEQAELITGIQGISAKQPRSNDYWSPNLTGDPNKDREAFNLLDNALKRTGYSDKQRRKMLYEIALEKYTPENAQKALGISAEEAAKWQR